MEIKKSPKADLEKRKGLHLEIGLVVALALALLAFNLKQYEKEVKQLQQREVIDEMEDVMITQPDQEMPEPEPEPQDNTTEIKIVDDNEELKNELGPIDAGDDANKEQQAYTPVEVKEEVEVVEEEIFQIVEENPEFPGGESALYKYLNDNLKYPTVARENGITGKVYIKFVVEKDGSISRAMIRKDIGGGCGAEALRVVNAMPRWKPGKQRGKAVRSEFTLPVSFELR
ncbi:MAG: energy transducer TonB [Bacteroidales bacterium]|nr:energy transducer TonB [Bacteroidales bacterium]MBP5759218.1 energy transducer TonB [Bacteroidales bacterium]